MVEHAPRVIVNQLFAKLGMVEHAQVFERMGRNKSTYALGANLVASTDG